MPTTCRYPCSEFGMFRRFHTPPVLGPFLPRALLFTGCPYQHAATKQRVWGEGGAGVVPSGAGVVPSGVGVVPSGVGVAPSGVGVVPSGVG